MIMFGRNNSSKVHALITEQIKDVEGCLINFENFMRAATTPETTIETLRSLSSGVHQMENAADRSLRRMIDSLNGSFLPSSREELISIATACDKIANKCEHTANMIVLQKFTFPREYAEDIMEIIRHTREQFSLLAESVSLLFAKFGEFLQDHSILDRIRECESRVDTLETKLMEQVFELDVDLAHQMQIARFIELLCDVSDIIENIADKIQIVVITRKA